MIASLAVMAIAALFGALATVALVRIAVVHRHGNSTASPALSAALVTLARFIENPHRSSQ